MAKLKIPLMSLKAQGRLGKLFSLAKRQGRNIIERRPIPTDAKSSNQLFIRHMFTKCIDLWHLLSKAEKQEWESAARPRHMTGYAWYISQCLRPNPGIYLPLQGGIMQGIIDMDGFEIENLKDPVAVQDADTKAARDAAIAAALADCIDSHIHGWDTANWQKLLVESATQHNLRVRLYGGANAIDTTRPEAMAYDITGVYSLYTQAMMTLWDSAIRGEAVKTARALGDAENGRYMPPAALWGWNGAKFDRLRTWGVGVLKVGRAEIDSTTVRHTAAGAVVAGSRKLFWVACSPDSPAAEWQLTDAIAGGAAIVYDHFDSDKHSEQITFDPPIKFSNGIFIEKFDHMKSLTFCYT